MNVSITVVATNTFTAGRCRFSAVVDIVLIGAASRRGQKATGVHQCTVFCLAVVASGSPQLLFNPTCRPDKMFPPPEVANSRRRDRLSQSSKGCKHSLECTRFSPSCKTGEGTPGEANTALGGGCKVLQQGRRSGRGERPGSAAILAWSGTYR